MTYNENGQGFPKKYGNNASRDGEKFDKPNNGKKLSLRKPNPNSDYSTERTYRTSNQEGRPARKSTSGRQRISVRKPVSSSDSYQGGSKYDRPQRPNSYGNQSDDRKRRPRIRTSDYNPNAKYSKKKQFEYRRDDVDPTKPIRLNKYLSNAGICSRREADDFISAGLITVNGEVITEMGAKVLPTDNVLFKNQPVQLEKKVYILLNKPKDTVTTVEDNLDRRTVLDVVKNACSERIYPVGRLDKNTTGVLLLTNDGELATKLTHPKYEKKKIYHVVLDKPLEIPDFEAVLSGVMLDDEKVVADELNFIRDDDFRHIGIEIHSGQNRVIRRIFENLGYKVVRLDRVFFAGLTKKNLPRGKYRFLTEKEVNMLKMGAYE